jgi:hypothetical protein
MAASPSEPAWRTNEAELDQTVLKPAGLMPGIHVPLSLEEHRELSHEIMRSRARLMELAQLVTGVYGAEGASGAAISGALRAMDRLCAQLAVQAEQDCPASATGKLYR